MGNLLYDLEKKAAINRFDLDQAIIDRKIRNTSSEIDGLLNDGPVKSKPTPKFKTGNKGVRYVNAYNKSMHERKGPVNPEVEKLINNYNKRQEGYAAGRERVGDMGAEGTKTTRAKSDTPTDFQDAEYSDVKTETPGKTNTKKADIPGKVNNNRNRNIGLGLAGLAAATGAGLYAHNKYKKRKSDKEEEKKASEDYGMSGLLNDLVKYASSNGYEVPKDFIDADYRDVSGPASDEPLGESPSKPHDFATKHQKKKRKEKGIPENFKTVKYKDVKDSDTTDTADKVGEGPKNLYDLGVKALPGAKKKGFKLGRNQKIGLGIAGAAAATGAGIYAHNRYKKKKQKEAEEKIAALLD